MTSSWRTKRKPASLINPLVDPGWHEEEEADRAASGELVVGHRAGDDDRIREDRAATGTEDASPLPEDGQPIGEVIHGIDAEQRIEGALDEGQGAVASATLKLTRSLSPASAASCEAVATPLSLASMPIT